MPDVPGDVIIASNFLLSDHDLEGVPENLTVANLLPGATKEQWCPLLAQGRFHRSRF